MEIATPRLSGKNYANFLKDLDDFIQECESLNLPAAPALDAFFYAYKSLDIQSVELVS
jgi:hypothetical protein